MDSLKKNKEIWVLLELEDGCAKNVGYELINAARPIADELGAELIAVAMGDDPKKAVADGICYGADKGIVVSGEEYSEYSTDAYSKALTTLIKKYDPEAVLIGATPNGRDLAPRAACRLGTGLTADCTQIGIDSESGNVAWTRPTFGGNLMATIICPKNRPQMGTVRPGVFKKGIYDEVRTGIIIEEKISVAPDEIRTLVVEHVREVTESINLEEAQIIVAGGVGVGSAENFVLLEELARAVGGVVGCSRRVVDEGWKPQAYQIGQSGKTVSPKLYFAIGISGSVQHMAGIAGAETIVAVNNDPEAPIFKSADYGIVGDFKEIIPELIKAFQ